MFLGHSVVVVNNTVDSVLLHGYRQYLFEAESVIAMILLMA